MNQHRESRGWTDASALRRLAAALAAAFFGLAPATGAVNAATDAPGLSDADRVCTGCHGSTGPSKTLANGDTLSLAIDAAALARSVHAPIGCAGCHAQVTLPDHPGNVKAFDSARQYALAQTQSCRACHDRVFETYERSVHALRLREGLSVAPVCVDCHPPHQVTPASVRSVPKGACVGCHGDVVQQHQSWLPNAANHLAAIACSACHAPDALRRVDLRIHSAAQPMRDEDGSLRFAERARAADANGDGLDANELRALLAGLERSGEAISLRGRVELRSGPEGHALPAKALAIRDCVSCHDANAAPFQNVTVSVLDASDRPLRHDAQTEILSSALTWDALRGFYAIGGTRFKLLDVVLAFGLVVGIAVPAVHLAVRRLLGRRPADDGERK